MKLDKFDGNWNKVRREIRAIRDAWKVEAIEQPGWTHRYMNFWRIVARKGPVICATLIGIGGPALAGLAAVGWSR